MAVGLEEGKLPIQTNCRPGKGWALPDNSCSRHTKWGLYDPKTEPDYGIIKKKKKTGYGISKKKNRLRDK